MMSMTFYDGLQSSQPDHPAPGGREFVGSVLTKLQYSPVQGSVKKVGSGSEQVQICSSIRMERTSIQLGWFK